MSIVSNVCRSAGAAVILLATAAVGAPCVGDCDDQGDVAINELILGVNIALSKAPLGNCSAFDPNGNGGVTIDELIGAVNAALNGCPITPTAALDTPTAEATATLPIFTQTPVLTPSVPTQPTAEDTPTATATLSVTATAVATSTVSPTAPPTEPVTPTPSLPASHTPTPSATSNVPQASATFTATATPTMGSATCGNGFLEPGETCGSCPDDCAVAECAATTSMTTFTVRFRSAPGTRPITGTTLLGYRSDRVSLPGSASAISVRQRVTFPAPVPNVIGINDLDYAVRVVIGRTAGLADGLLYSVQFDVCDGTPAASEADFACTMEACAGSGGPIADCTCTVVMP